MSSLMSRLASAGKMMAARRALRHQRCVHNRITFHEANEVVRSNVEMAKRDLKIEAQKYHGLPEDSVSSFRVLELNNLAVFFASMSLGLYTYFRDPAPQRLAKLEASRELWK